MKTEESILNDIKELNESTMEKLKELPDFKDDENLLRFVKGLRDVIMVRESYQAILDEE